MRSIAEIFVSVIVNLTRVTGLPSVAVTTPAPPLISAGKMTLAAIAEGGCFGTHSALAVLDGFASSLGYSHTTRVFGASQCLSASR